MHRYCKQTFMLPHTSDLREEPWYCIQVCCSTVSRPSCCHAKTTRERTLSSVFKYAAVLKADLHYDTTPRRSERGPRRLSIALRIHPYCQQTFMLPQQDDRGEDPHVLYSSMHRYCHAKTIRDCIQVCIGTVSRTLCYHAKTT